MKSKVAGAALLLLLLTLGAEAKICLDRSQTFKGQCTHDVNCAAVCVTENYTGGYCHGFLRRECFCIKNCDSLAATNPPPKPPKEEEPPEEPEPPARN